MSRFGDLSVESAYPLVDSLIVASGYRMVELKPGANYG